jgi:tetratricopeptide (TPR) repeat protein
VKQGISLSLLLFFLFTWSTTAWSEEAPGQGEESIIGKILNPLPDYDPFVKSVPSPRFFPDKVNKQVHEALIDSLTDQDGAMEEHGRFFKEKDAELLEERGTVTGLTDHVSDLQYNTIRDSQDYLTAQKKALDSASTEKQKNLIRSRIRNDEATQAAELLRKSRTNMWGAFFNRLLGSVNLVSVASGSYVGAAVDSVVTQLLDVGSVDMSIEERKALTLYLEYLKRHPNDPNRKEILKIIEALETKKKRFLVHKHIEKAEEALSEGELTRAELNYEMAALIDPESSEAIEGIENLRERIRLEGEERREALSPLEEVAYTDSSPSGDRELPDLLYALALGDPVEIEAQAKAIGEKHQGKPLEGSAKDALAVSLEIKGHHKDAKGILENLAGSSTSARQRKRAKALLENPEYNLFGSLEKARTQYRLKTVKFVLLGEDFLQKNLALSASPLITHGLAGASSWGIANLLIVGTNLLQVMSSNPISSQSIIDKGVAYIRSHPESENASDVYRVLAKAYEEAGAYDKAIAYYQSSGTASEKEIADLKDKAAETLLRAAEKSKDNRATKKLAHQIKNRNRGIRISKEFLMENPELYGPNGLGLKASLFDGKTSNMELADKGINLLSKRKILFHFESQWGIQSRPYPAKKEIFDRFKLALREKHYEIAMGDIHTRTKGSPGGIRNLPPQILGEARDKKPPTSEKTNLSFVRKATGSPSTFPKVLDYELLSENEKNPESKFKLPKIQGSVSASKFSLSGSLPSALWGDRVMLGTDEKSPFAGLQLPIPLLQDFIPVDFLIQGRPGQPSLNPRIHRFNKKEGKDDYLYR